MRGGGGCRSTTRWCFQSICRSIIELHGGRIWAAPNVPHGATIEFTLPLHPGIEKGIA
jgi:signal transduction histidine kinase